MTDDHRGPVILREKPRQQLIDRPAYALPDGAELEDYRALADWIRFRGGDVKHVDADGVLVASRDEDADITYAEWITAPALVVHDEYNQFGTYGYSMHEHYVVEPSVDDFRREVDS